MSSEMRDLLSSNFDQQLLILTYWQRSQKFISFMCRKPLAKDRESLIFETFEGELTLYVLLNAVNRVNNPSSFCDFQGDFCCHC